MKNIYKIDLGLYNNDITEKGVNKLCKVLTNKPYLHDVSINLNNNSIKVGGVE